MELYINYLCVSTQANKKCEHSTITITTNTKQSLS